MNYGTVFSCEYIEFMFISESSLFDWSVLKSVIQIGTWNDQKDRTFIF